jgi:hypothetical protein
MALARSSKPNWKAGTTSRRPRRTTTARPSGSVRLDQHQAGALVEGGDERVERVAAAEQDEVGVGVRNRDREPAARDAKIDRARYQVVVG